MRLILKVYYTDGYTYSHYGYVAFEYESRAKFIFDILEKFKDIDVNDQNRKYEIFKFGPELDFDEIMNIERNVYEYGSEEFWYSFYIEPTIEL